MEYHLLQRMGGEEGGVRGGGVGRWVCNGDPVTLVLSTFKKEILISL